MDERRDSSAESGVSQHQTPELCNPESSPFAPPHVSVSTGSEAILGTATECGLVKIFSLGRFEILLDGVPLQFSPKTPRKPLALLQGLLCAGSRGATRGKLLDALWPESDPRLGRRALNTALYRLRRLLRHRDVITINDGWIALNPQRCWVDAWDFERALGQATEPAAVACALRLYEGAFLEDTDHPLAFEARNRLRRKFTRAVLHVGQYFEGIGNIAAARQLYDDGLEADGTCEDLYRALMRCWAQEGNAAAVGAVYQRCRMMLWRHFAVAPSEATEQIYRDARASGGTGSSDVAVSEAPHKARWR